MRKERVLSYIFLYMAGAAIALVAAEIVFRLLGWGFGNAPMESDPVLHHRHPRNYSFLVHDPNGEFGGHRVHYDSRGLVTRPGAASSGEKETNCESRIALMGDSCVEATQVAFGKSFFGRMVRSARPGVCVWNYGVSSYSPAIYLLQWKTVIRQDHPTHVFLLLHSNDIRDDAWYSQRGTYSADGELTAVPGLGRDTWKIWFRRSYVVRVVRMAYLKTAWAISHAQRRTHTQRGGFDESAGLTPKTAEYLQGLAREVRDSGAEFILMAVPPKAGSQGESAGEEGGSFYEKAREWAQKKRYPVDRS